MSDGEAPLGIDMLPIPVDGVPAGFALAIAGPCGLGHLGAR